MVDFNKVRQSDLWYVIGYIATDGNLSVDKRHINITSKDKSHLYLIRNALFLESKIRNKFSSYNTTKRSSYLAFSDAKFYRYLVTLGLFPNKSLTLGAITVDDHYFMDFLRGVIDGDGNISTWVHHTNLHSQWCVRIFSASPPFINWLNGKIEETFKVRGKTYSYRRVDRINPHYQLKFGQKAAEIILKKIYYTDSLSLERKFIQAQLCLQHGSKNGKLCR